MKKIQKKQKVLVVEDDLPVLRALVDKLEREGFDVISAKDGEEGLKVALSNHPDIILLDILMPILDGSTMLKMLREKNAWGKKVPVILLTNLSNAEQKVMKAVIESEPAYYLVKSNWSMAEVIKRVKETLEKQNNEKN